MASDCPEMSHCDLGLRALFPPAKQKPETDDGGQEQRETRGEGSLRDCQADRFARVVVRSRVAQREIKLCPNGVHVGNDVIEAEQQAGVIERRTTLEEKVIVGPLKAGTGLRVQAAARRDHLYVDTVDCHSLDDVAYGIDNDISIPTEPGSTECNGIIKRRCFGRAATPRNKPRRSPLIFNIFIFLSSPSFYAFLFSSA